MTYSVMVTRTRTIVSTCEIEVTAKDEESAQSKIEEKVTKAAGKVKGLEAFDWDEQSDDDEFEYEATEA